MIIEDMRAVEFFFERRMGTQNILLLSTTSYCMYCKEDTITVPWRVVPYNS